MENTTGQNVNDFRNPTSLRVYEVKCRWNQPACDSGIDNTAGQNDKVVKSALDCDIEDVAR